MGIQINGLTDIISATDGSLTIQGQELTNVTDINASGIITASQINVGTAITISGGIITATSFSGSGANLTDLPAGAPVGGASTNTVFFENAQEVAVDYTITTSKNAMSAGPIGIATGITVTIPSGSTWSIV